MKVAQLAIAAFAVAAISFQAASAAPVVSNNAADAAYNGGFLNGVEGGTGCGAWIISTPTNSSSFTANSRANGFGGGGGINTPGGSSGRAWGLSSSDGATATATLPFDAPVAVGHSVKFWYDNGFMETGGTARAALQNSSGEDLLYLGFTGGGGFDVVDAGGATSTGLGFTSDGFSVEITLLTASTYSATITKYFDGSSSTVTGTLLSPAGGQAVDRVAFSAIAMAPSGLSGDQGWFFHFNNVIVDDNAEAIVASDSAADGGYDGGFFDTTTGGMGLGAWTVALDINAASFTGNSRVNGFSGGRGVNTAGRAWGLSAPVGESASATRTLSTPLEVGGVFSYQMDYGFVEGGGVAKTALQNAAGEDLASVSFTGGGNFDVVDASGATNTGLGFSSSGFGVEFVLTSASTFTATITRLNDNQQAFVSGTLANPPGGQSVERFAFSSTGVAPAAFPSDPGWAFYVNAIQVREGPDAPAVSDSLVIY